MSSRRCQNPRRLTSSSASCPTAIVQAVSGASHRARRGGGASGTSRDVPAEDVTHERVDLLAGATGISVEDACTWSASLEDL